MTQFRLPDVGEGLIEAEIIDWAVAVGETVTLNQTLVQIETAKAVVDLPSPCAGVVRALLVPPGRTVPVGTPIIEFETDPGGPAPEPAPEPVLVGYGVSEPAAGRRPRRPRPVATPPAGPGPEPHTLAKPLVRKLARDLGVDLRTVTPQRPDGVISRADVEQAAASVVPSGTAGDVFAPSYRIPVRGVRRATAAAMVGSAFTAPHVTEFLTVDVTRTVKLVRKLRADPSFEGVRISPSLVAAKALLAAVARYPEVNASWDEATEEIIRYSSVNLGVAVATPRGLLVPNLKAPERLSLRELAVAMGELVATARAGTAPLAALTGGTITLTNIGVFGVDSGTPILNPGEAVILLIGTVRKQPWVVTDKRGRSKVRPRWVTTLGLSFDHRLVDGELGSRFLVEIGRGLEDPVAALL